ncbi:uncharacterized protein TNCV_3838451 [Trichonephila clavipes]|nr:uncharacterized protein TNCV_3838451 [Trichonephila clavipes]
MFVVSWALLVLTVLVRPSENAVPPRIQAEIPMPKAPEKKDLYIGAIFPINGTGGWLGGQGCLPAALMALEDVNAEPNLLPGYKMKMPYNDSQSQKPSGQGIGSWLACHEFEPSTIKDWSRRGEMHVKSVESSNVTRWCYVVVGRGGASSDVVLVT